jgi:hypothetical protein
MPRILLSAVSIFLFSFLPTHALAKATCEDFLRIEATINRELPRSIDQATELVQVRVNCELQSMTFVKRLLVNEAMLAQGWQPRKLRQHNQLNCNKRGLARVEGWTARDLVYSEDQVRLLAEFITTPTDCN